MPVERVRLDFEVLGLVMGAALLSYFMTGAVVSNILFTLLIMSLFFLIGLNLDIGKVKDNLHNRNELIFSVGLVYILTPALAFLVATLIGGGLGDAFIAIGVSAAALGSSLVWSNIGKGEGNVAFASALTTVLVGVVAIPLLLIGFNVGVPVLNFIVKNLIFVGAPLLLGVAAKRYENVLLDDFQHHFSKVALWLLLLVTSVQLNILYLAEGLAIVPELAASLGLMTGFVAVSFGLGYFISREAGIMERKARSIGFVSSSKALGIALFVAAQLSAEAVMYVSLYFFVRQSICGMIAEYFRHGEFLTLENLLSGWSTKPFVE